MLPTVNWMLNKSLDDIVDDDDAQTYPASSQKEVCGSVVKSRTLESN